MISTKYLQIVQSFLLSGFMSFMMSGIITFINLGFVNAFISIWLQAWIFAFMIASPTILLVFPFARKLAMFITSK